MDQIKGRFGLIWLHLRIMTCKLYQPLTTIEVTRLTDDTRVMFDAVMYIKVIQVEGVLVIVPLEKLCRVPWDEITERRSKIEDFIDHGAHCLEGDILPISREYTVVTESIQSYSTGSISSDT